MDDMRYLTSEEIDGLAPVESYVEVVLDAYRQRGEGAPAEPRTKLTNAMPAGFLTGYFAILPDSGAMGGYTYSAGFESADAHFVLPLFDSESGKPLALLDGAAMNPYKTGAAGAVGVDALARKDASRVGLIGSGTQARGQLLAVDTVRNLTDIAVYSPTRKHREAFADEMDQTIDGAVEAVNSASAAIREADIVITATTATDPVFDGSDLEPGTHVTAMGQYHPRAREVDATTVARATYVPDLAARIEHDAGAYLLAREEGAIDDDHIHAELGEVVAGKAAGRTDADEITLFDSGGTGIETVAAAKMLYDRAIQEDLGTTLPISSANEAFVGRQSE